MLAPGAGAQLGNYVLVRALGSGGMGVVFEGRHKALGRRVAVKILHARAPGAPDAAVLAERFLREGRAAAQVQHAHVVDVFDFGVQDGTAFLVMELVDGETLAQRLEREGKLPLASAVELLLPVLSAVAELHVAGIVHRDLKPANILLANTRSGEVCPKVADFGVSRMDDGSPALTDSGTVLGTYAYMSPEQTRGSRDASEKTDQYALGVLLYECATGTLPFDGDTPYALTNAIVHGSLAPPSARNPELPEAFDAVVLRAMSREPEARFASLEELAEALLPFAAGEVATRWAGEFRGSQSIATTGPMPPVTRASQNRKREDARRGQRATIAVGAAVVLGVVVTAGALAARIGKPEVRAESDRAVAIAPPPSAPPASQQVAEVPAADAPATTAQTTTAAPTTPATSAPKPARKRPPAPPAERRRRGDGAGDNGAPILDPE